MFTQIKLFLLIIAFVACAQPAKKDTTIIADLPEQKQEITTQSEKKLVAAALSIIDDEVVYTPTYVVIPYPNGDVPKKTGVCTDVIIRAYRKIGIDLQQEVHNDMKNNLSAYPKNWNMNTTDTNIDHRRVPNLEVFFTRKGKKLVITQNPEDYKPGEIVTWMINNKLPHIGIVTDKKSSDGKRPLIVHNIGSGQVLEDCLFNYKVVGHFEYENQ